MFRARAALAIVLGAIAAPLAAQTPARTDPAFDSVLRFEASIEGIGLGRDEVLEAALREIAARAAETPSRP